MKVKGLILVAACSAILLAAGCSNSEKDEAVATFEGGSVSKSELYDSLVDQYGTEALEVLILDKVIIKEAEKLKVKVSKDEIEVEVAKIAEQYGGTEALEQVLAASNLTVADIKEDLETSLLLEKALAGRINVTDEEIKTYFDANSASLDTPEQVKASHILVKDKATADKLLKELQGGADFSKIAKDQSIDTGSAIEGGDLGFFGKGTMVEAFEKVAFSLEVNKLSKVVETEHGFHIIKVFEKKEAKKATLESSKEVIRETLVDQKMQEAYNSWVKEKYEEYKVETKLSE